MPFRLPIFLAALATCDASAQTVPRLFVNAGRVPYAAAVSSDGAYVATVGGTSALVWEGATGRIVQDLPVLDGLSVAFFPNDRRIAIGVAGSGVRVFDLATAAEVARLPAMLPTQAVAVTGTGAVLTGVHTDLVYWTPGEADARIYALGDTVKAVAASPDWQTLCAGGSQGWVQCWDATSGTIRWRVSLPDAFYLFPSDIGGPDLELTDRLSHAISADTLSAWLQGVDAGEMTIIVDACHSAAAVESGGFKPGPFAGRGFGQLAYLKGIRVLVASQADAVAVESGQLEHGLLTYALIREGIERDSADTDRDGAVRLDEWLAYGERRVPGLVAGLVRGDRGLREALVGSWRSGSRPLRARGIDLPRGRPTDVIQRPILFDFTQGRRRATRLR